MLRNGRRRGEESRTGSAVLEKEVADEGARRDGAEVARGKGGEGAVEEAWVHLVMKKRN